MSHCPYQDTFFSSFAYHELTLHILSKVLPIFCLNLYFIMYFLLSGIGPVDFGVHKNVYKQTFQFLA